ncbi:hypothetical protein RDI58_000854 [Solanum bulbocastanum]|uniref:Uncharacterized protein n=1 Tax=Solanum bulbocastanum TaxID=147425 RepID=A0AAN8YPF5_SOLBU
MGYLFDYFITVGILNLVSTQVLVMMPTSGYANPHGYIVFPPEADRPMSSVSCTVTRTPHHHLLHNLVCRVFAFKVMVLSLKILPKIRQLQMSGNLKRQFFWSLGSIKEKCAWRPETLDQNLCKLSQESWACFVLIFNAKFLKLLVC